MSRAKHVQWDTVSRGCRTTRRVRCPHCGAVERQEPECASPKVGVAPRKVRCVSCGLSFSYPRGSFSIGTCVERHRKSTLERLVESARPCTVHVHNVGEVRI